MSRYGEHLLPSQPTEAQLEKSKKPFEKAFREAEEESFSRNLVWGNFANTRNEKIELNQFCEGVRDLEGTSYVQLDDLDFHARNAGRVAGLLSAGCIDNSLRDQVASTFSDSSIGNDVVNPGSLLDAILRAQMDLNVLKAPFGNRFVVLHPETWYHLEGQLINKKIDYTSSNSDSRLAGTAFNFGFWLDTGIQAVESSSNYFPAYYGSGNVLGLRLDFPIVYPHPSGTIPHTMNWSVTYARKFGVEMFDTPTIFRICVESTGE